MNNLEESTKIGKETRFAIIGRAIADNARAGLPFHALLQEAATLRRMEQDSAHRTTRFAALARQIGDARRNGNEIAALLAELQDLRRAELGPTPSHC